MRILRILAGERLPCGCLLGIYETYEGRVARIIDERHATCSDPAHRRGRVLTDLEATEDGARPSAPPRARVA